MRGHDDLLNAREGDYRAEQVDGGLESIMCGYECLLRRMKKTCHNIDRLLRAIGSIFEQKLAGGLFVLRGSKEFHTARPIDASAADTPAELLCMPGASMSRRNVYAAALFTEFGLLSSCLDQRNDAIFLLLDSSR